MTSPIPKTAPNHSAAAAAADKGGELGGAAADVGPVDEQDLTARKYGEALMNGLSSVAVVVGYSKGEADSGDRKLEQVVVMLKTVLLLLLLFTGFICSFLFVLLFAIISPIDRS